LSFSSPADLAPEGAWFAFLLLSWTRLASCAAIVAPFDDDLSVLGCSVLFALSALLANANARQAAHSGQKRALGAMDDGEEETEEVDKRVEQVLSRVDENMLRAILAGCNLASSFVSNSSSEDIEVATTSKGKGKGKRKAQEEPIAATQDTITTNSSSSCPHCQDKFVVDVLLLLLQTNSIWAHLHDQLFTKEPARSQLVSLLVSFLEAKHHNPTPRCSTCSSSSSNSGNREAALRQLQSVSVRDFASLASVFRVAVGTCLSRLHASLTKFISKQQQQQQQQQSVKRCIEMLFFLIDKVPHSLWLIDENEARKESAVRRRNSRRNGDDEDINGGKVDDEEMQVDEQRGDEEAAPVHLLFEIVSLAASSLTTLRSGNNDFASVIVQVLEIASKALVPFFRASHASTFTRHLMHRFADINGLFGHLVSEATKNRGSSSGDRNLLEMVALLANELLCTKYSSSSSLQEQEDKEGKEEDDAVLAALLATGVKALELEDDNSPAMYLFQVTCTSLSALPWSLIKEEEEAKAEAGLVEAEVEKVGQKVAKGKKSMQQQKQQRRQTLASRVMAQVEMLLTAIAKHEGAQNYPPQNSSSRQAVTYLVKGQALRLLVSLDMLAAHPQTLPRLLGSETSELAQGWIFFTGSLLHAQRAAGHMLLPAVSQALVQQVSLAFSLLRDDKDNSKQEHVSLLVTGLLFCTERIAVPRVCDSLVSSCCGGDVSCSPLVAAQIALALLESSSLARSHVGSHALTASRLLLESASARSLLVRGDYDESSHQPTRPATHTERFVAEELLQISRALLYGLSLYKQRKGKGREKRGADETAEAGGGGSSKEDDAASAWSAWTSSCIKVLASLATRILSLDSELPSGTKHFGSRAQMSSHVLAVLEQLLSGPSNALIGTCIASICLTLSQLAHVCLGDFAALGAARRVLIAAAASADACKHAHMLCVAMLELLAASPSSTSREDVEALSPGVFALFDRCNSRQRKQIFAMLGTQGRAVYSDVHATYLRDYKFKGKA